MLNLLIRMVDSRAVEFDLSFSHLKIICYEERTRGFAGRVCLIYKQSSVIVDQEVKNLCSLSNGLLRMFHQPEVQTQNGLDHRRALEQCYFLWKPMNTKSD